jgi:hypothetical protein
MFPIGHDATKPQQGPSLLFCNIVPQLAIKCMVQLSNGDKNEKGPANSEKKPGSKSSKMVAAKNSTSVDNSGSEIRYPPGKRQSIKCLKFHLNFCDVPKKKIF